VVGQKLKGRGERERKEDPGGAGKENQMVRELPQLFRSVVRENDEDAAATLGLLDVG